MRLRQVEAAELQLHPPGLDLGQVEDVVDERQQVAAGGQDVVEVLLLLVVELAEQPLQQHLGEADDRVERRAQLVRHVGQELDLVPVGHLAAARLLSSISRNSRAFWMASADWVAKVCSRSTVSGAKPPASAADDDQRAEDPLLAAAAARPAPSR